MIAASHKAFQCVDTAQNPCHSGVYLVRGGDNVFIAMEASVWLATLVGSSNDLNCVCKAQKLSKFIDPRCFNVENGAVAVDEFVAISTVRLVSASAPACHASGSSSGSRVATSTLSMSQG